MTNGMGLVDRVYHSVDGITRKQAQLIVNAIAEAIAESLKQGESVRVPGFGSFFLSERGARRGRNPATGEPITIKASKTVRFKASRELKANVQTRKRRR